MTGREFYLWQARGFTVRLALDVVDRIGAALEKARDGRSEEKGGILLGRALAADAVEITGFEFFKSQHRRGVAYDLGLNERSRLARYVARLRGRRAEVPVGYFRTHLRPGLFLDQDDFALMTDAFHESSSVALTIAPGGNAGFFFWEEDDIDRTRTHLAFPFASAALREAGPVAALPGARSKASQARRFIVPLWEALALAMCAAVAGFGLVSGSTRPARPVAAQAQEGFVPPRPVRPLTPTLPPGLAAGLKHEVPVDVRVSVDKDGTVRDAEVVKGGGTPFSSIASDNAFWSRWQPARERGRNVASQIVVHYRFKPEPEGRP